MCPTRGRPRTPHAGEGTGLGSRAPRAGGRGETVQPWWKPFGCFSNVTLVLTGCAPALPPRGVCPRETKQCCHGHCPRSNTATSGQSCCVNEARPQDCTLCASPCTGTSRTCEVSVVMASKHISGCRVEAGLAGAGGDLGWWIRLSS